MKESVFESTTTLDSHCPPRGDDSSGKIYRTRPVRCEDLEIISQHRLSMFIEAGLDRKAVCESVTAFRAWLSPRLSDGSYYGWMVEDAEGSVVAGLGMLTIDWPPHPRHPGDDRRGYVLNVYVNEPHRKRGLATHLMTMAEREGRLRKLSLIVLHATDQGRPVYEKLGWASMNEMALEL